MSTGKLAGYMCVGYCCLMIGMTLMSVDEHGWGLPWMMALIVIFPAVTGFLAGRKEP